MKQQLILSAAALVLTACGGSSEDAEPVMDPAMVTGIQAEPVPEEPEPLSPEEQAAANAKINLMALAAYRDHAEKVKVETGTYPLTKRSFRSATGAFEDAAEAAAAEGEKVDLELPEGAEMTAPGAIVYRSDGDDYKLIAQRTGDCSVVRETEPGLIDPKRTYGPGDCIAYGYWTIGAEEW